MDPHPSLLASLDRELDRLDIKIDCKRRAGDTLVCRNRGAHRSAGAEDERGHGAVGANLPP
nr:hypothetical protein GCM10010200_035100 [Actinomadura rugatobispora]